MNNELEHLSLDEPTLADILVDPTSMEEETERRDMVDYIFRTLVPSIRSKRAQQILTYRLKDGLSYDVIGDLMHITPEYVRQIEHRSICALRHLISRSEIDSRVR
jgi:DNA-directed RNA polymerase sigma subunit (sigma70/sigma32)